ncbi:MAG: hypothetical protein F6K19_32240 [Cyanothece sp. SIO1E1]|nr:hypothetical protein [Cyanothece sp. SIO1E1]
MSDLSNIRHKIAEMRAETEAWVTRNRQMDAQRQAKQHELQPTLADLMKLMQQLSTEVATIKAKLFN